MYLAISELGPEEFVPERKGTEIREIKTALGLARGDGDVRAQSVSDLTPVLKARLLLRESKPDEAQIVLEEALAELNNKPAYNTIRYVALGALAHRAMGDEKRALASLQHALEFGEAENRVASFVREGEAMEKLLRLAQPKTTTPQFVQQLLQAFESRHIIKPQPDIVSEAMIEALSEREMDILKLLAQGYCRQGDR